HCVFDHSGKFLYVINEMGNTIYSYAYDDKQGVLTEIQIISTIPQNYHEHTTTSAIKVHPNGNFLYGSNRGHDSLATYKINHENGLLELVAIQSTLGRVPRDFDFTPDGKFLVVANQESNNLIVFRVDGDTGLFYEVSRVNDVFTGTCVKIYEMD
ncbi:MAG: beta-propeller fold lactonase family protein, partial [Sphaerochaetaceae bacterium]|nr:beta-propeller fold lactonase family protein [Sphaerochaetaceae bacterium]